MAQPSSSSRSVVLAVIPVDDRGGDLSQALGYAAEAAGLEWHASDPAEAEGDLATLLDGGHSVGVIGVGRGGQPALEVAASDGRVGALGLISAPVAPEMVELVADWPELPTMVVADPGDRPALKSTVDVHLASAHQTSDVLIGPVDASSIGEVMEWLQARLTQVARVDEVTFTSSDGWELHGTRWLPVRDHPVPGVVMLHTGRSDRAVFARLERLVAEAGMAVLNFDWRGRGQSLNRGTYFDLSSEEKAAAWRDALAAVEHLASQPEVDSERMGAVGVVHGAEYAVRAAVRDARLRALVLLTGYRPADESESEHLTSGKVEVLYVTSTDHTITTDAMHQLYVESPGRLTRYVEYPGGAIGYQLFEVDRELEPAVVAWLSEVLVP